MDINKQIEQLNLTGLQKNLAKSMLLTGASLDTVTEAIKGYNIKSEKSFNSFECPRCKSTMVLTTLVGNKKVKYCLNDNIVIPIKTVF